MVGTEMEDAQQVLLIQYNKPGGLPNVIDLLLEAVPRTADARKDLLVKYKKPEASSQNTDLLVVETVPSFPNDDLDMSQVLRLKTREEIMEDLILQKTRYASDDIAERAATREKYLKSKNTRWRFVFNIWPRNTQGSLLPSFDSTSKSSLGKTTGREDQLMWGATLADFYHVPPILPGVSQISTSSRLYNWCRAQGEDCAPARHLMRLAETEDRPRPIHVYSLEQLIRNSESWIRGLEGASWIRPATPDDAANRKDREDWEVPELWPPTSVFSPSAYPKPWPFEPFKKNWWHPEEKFGNFIHVPKLQHYIPQHLLPETLVVHDPWELLHANRGGYYHDKSMPWIEKDDIVRIYKLKPPMTERPRQKQDLEECEEQVAKTKAIREAFLANPHSSIEMPDGMIYKPTTELKLGPSEPPVYVVFPSKPPQAPAKLAHLYMSPAASLGKGSHSFVYSAEFEVPRSLVVSDEMCKECVLNDVKRILEEEGGRNGERRASRWNEPSGRYTIKKQGKPPRNVMLGDEEHQWTADTREVEVAYEGPYRAVQTAVGYQNLERGPYCEHLCKENIHPLTTKVQVAAKISVEYDDHLEKEADKYQRFPKDFFQHYNGLNIVSPLLEPTPVGALVPQFYGYYMLDENDDRNEEYKDAYSSSILLVEDCGVSIEPKDLSMDDRSECASLIYRFHAAKWFHGSPFKRNIVRQPGPLNVHPMIRQANADEKRGDRLGTEWSYRLIDFGRTDHQSRADEKDYDWNTEYEMGKMKNWLWRNIPI